MFLSRCEFVWFLVDEKFLVFLVCGVVVVMLLLFFDIILYFILSYLLKFDLFFLGQLFVVLVRGIKVLFLQLEFYIDCLFFWLFFWNWILIFFVVLFFVFVVVRFLFEDDRYIFGVLSVRVMRWLILVKVRVFIWVWRRLFFGSCWMICYDLGLVMVLGVRVVVVIWWCFLFCILLMMWYVVLVMGERVCWKEEFVLFCFLVIIICYFLGMEWGQGGDEVGYIYCFVVYIFCL